ncbi:MAG: hypothetical protein RLZZ347_772 [Candidatus Parcubacteria bacterium]|jgi:replicative DNA helicase
MDTTAKKHLRIPPQNIDSEKALLGSVMLRPEAMNDIMDIVSFESFYAEKHRTIFKTMLELFAKGEPIDLLTISTKLTDKGMIEQVGGMTYITELANSVPSSANIEFYARIVQKKSMMRRLIEVSEHISHIGYNDDQELEELLDLAEQKIYAVTNMSGGNNKVIELKDALGEAWERLDKLHKTKDELRGIPTGFKEIDNKLGGLQKSDLIILAARPSMGKTSLALDIARQAATVYKVPTIIFSLEMSSAQLVDRMMAADSRVDAWKLRTGKLTQESEFAQIRDSMAKLANAPIFIDDRAANNIINMRSAARRIKSEKGLGLIVVDYLQLMAPTQSRNSDNMVQQVTEISRSLKHLAKELDVPVLALSQLSRAVEQRGGKPRLSDLRDSGSIEQDADVVMFIHREDKMNRVDESAKTNIAEILIEKHRNGPTGSCQLFFDEKKATYLNLEKGEFGDFESGGGSSGGMGGF